MLISRATMNLIRPSWKDGDLVVLLVLGTTRRVCGGPLSCGRLPIWLSKLSH